ncbi:MAG: tRNA-specific 2-thiouridylase MnmA [Alphaproteobacteria bacterium MarineAlpha2_Bin1]|nr:MAG: tRNA-specific 2-thiouridylase MnmA [Alphaproteobacteria bacterium MarineAlpha2_Bin1]
MENSLGIAKKPSNTRVVVAMSGGVDSSVVAAMLKYEGYEVIGITLQLYSSNNSNQKTKTCCAGQDVIDARRVADSIGIKHYVFDYEKVFKDKVIDEFISSYQNGLTPIPCINCNQEVKFKDLLDTARKLNADAMATGHYIRRLSNKNINTLHKAKDYSRDQSYFLFNITPDQLKFLRFPLGEFHKSEVRSLAAEYGLLVADKKDSQDICFVPDGDYVNTIEKIDKDKKIPGNIVDSNGKILGEHSGIINFTVGQRRGIKIGNSFPYYVLKIDASKNQVIVGHKDLLFVNRVKLNNVNLIGNLEDINSELHVKLRSTQVPVEASLKKSKDKWLVTLRKSERGVSPGQACVFYKEDMLVGGGWITSAY